VFIAGIVAEMAPKPRQVEGEENPFLLPPVDLDKIPLVDKDRLIVDTKCDFDFSDLQSWLREVFLDQSDEIGLWESNLPLYLFPQIHHFPEFALKCQAHYIPKQRVAVSSSRDILFLITPKAIDQMMQIPRADSASLFNLEILTELYQKMTFPQRALRSDQLADELSRSSHLSSQMRSCEGFINDLPKNPCAVAPSHQAVPRFRRFVKLVRLKIELARPDHL
jgi:hypothetical protein